MKAPPRRLLLWGALPVVLVALAVWSWTPRETAPNEPSWEGRLLSSWLPALEMSEFDARFAGDEEQRQVAAFRAIQGMGTNCLPFLFWKLDHLNPTLTERMLITLEGEVRKRSVRLPWDSTEQRVGAREHTIYRALESLGPQATPVVPELQRWLICSNNQKVECALRLLAVIHPEGTAALIVASTNRNHPRREAVFYVLHRVADEHPEALATFLSMADDPDPHIRREAARHLTKHSPQAKFVLPVLIHLLADPDERVRMETIWCLDAIYKGDLRAAVPALTSLADDTSLGIKVWSKSLLQKINSRSATLPPAAPMPPP